ncbi:xanthine dehydrogenase/oxidase-like [Corticium candelabrum]|uniref:xanthine dehydrogenase/oxidase-like n=1 Tax=Corticium candelabrum TaxID=121492 RepID=UPI002E26A25D|nr:xanthine dehydrogenase/oxidase-like [Corticium candelabrum]
MSDKEGCISFSVNGKLYKLHNVNPSATLNQWLRCQPHLKGTKQMCNEGGCGACVVAITQMDLTSNCKRTISVNSCLFSLISVDNCDVVTTEGLGNSRDGFHQIQERLADGNGSQCGFCSPGIVMSMFGLLKQNPRPTEQQIEDNFDGNICRCTGYRPILDSMKTFAAERNPIDIEDLNGQFKCSMSCGDCPCEKYVFVPQNGGAPKLWLKPRSLVAALKEIAFHSDARKVVRIVAGQTARGVFKNEESSDVYLDIKYIPELHRVKVTDDCVTIGSAVTLSRFIQVLKENESTEPKYKALADHLYKVANVAVRNVATWAGNLMMAKSHPEFPSDLVTILDGAGACLTIVHHSSSEETVDIPSFLQLDMADKIIVDMTIRGSEQGEQFCTFKVMPRSKNAHAYVNAAFSVVPSQDGAVKQAHFVFGGIGYHLTKAVKTENFMKGRQIKDAIQGALEVLSSEIHAQHFPAASSRQHREGLVIALFYKFCVMMVRSTVSPCLRSAADSIYRDVSSSTQEYSSDTLKYPLTKPMPKLSAKLQASGEAEYVDDIPTYPNEVHGAFILSTQANARLLSMDVSKALSMPGVIQILGANDIPHGGVNNWYDSSATCVEPVFANDTVSFAGQALGLVIAETQAQAYAAARLVECCYDSLGKPILSMEEAIKADSLYPDHPDTIVSGDGDPVTAWQQSAHQVTGRVSCGNQAHFHMETQRCLTVPTEDGFDVFSSTQSTTRIQKVVAHVLGITNSSLNVSVRRIGGGFGGKLTNCGHTAAAASVAAYTLRRPVRVVLDLEANMKMFGSRDPCMADYQVGFDDIGRILAVVMTVYSDFGFSNNDETLDDFQHFFDNAYYIPHWQLDLRGCRTHKARNTWCRAPGSVSSVFILESIMEHVAKKLGKNPNEVRYINLYQKGQMTPHGQCLSYCNLSSLWIQLLNSAEYEKRQREVAAFNKDNRWKKRGLSVVPLKYGMDISWGRFSVLVSIYGADGSVAISHGGIEMGQGINTKVIQVAASALGIDDLSIFKIKPTNVLTAANNSISGGSIASELNCQAVLQACQQLNERLKPIRKGLPEDATWKDVIKKCKDEDRDLSARAWVEIPKPELGPFEYNTYGVTVTEAELDVLTGENVIRRVDVLYDCGESMNPDIDIGQAEGAFIMGLGYWLSERFIHDPETGELLTCNTWEYKPPLCQDIPADFRVSLLKDAPNPVGILRSKTSGEPPLCMSCSVLFAIKHAVESAREEIGVTDYFTLDGPATVDAIQVACRVHHRQFTL